MTAVERGPEQQEALSFDIDQELNKSPEVPQDRQEIYRKLTENKGVALAGLLLAIGTIATSTEARAQTSEDESFAYPRPANAKMEETNILERFKQGDQSTVYRYGLELESLTEQKTEQGEETVASGEVGRTIIEQLTRMMIFCDKHGVRIENVYDISKIKPDLVKEATRKYVQAKMISSQEGQKPTQEKFAKTTKTSETLRRTGR